MRTSEGRQPVVGSTADDRMVTGCLQIFLIDKHKGRQTHAAGEKAGYARLCYCSHNASNRQKRMYI